MRFALASFAALAVSSAVAAPVENGPTDVELMLKARALVKRNNAGLRADLVKRNNDGGSGGSSSGLTDADILNFALNLEYLEAQFYHIAAFGTQLSQDLLSGTGKRGYIQNNAGMKVPFSSDVTRQYATEIAIDEMNHVKFLRSALGDAAVAMPEINLNESFTGAAVAAGIIKQGEQFNPFSSDANFLLGAYLFEDVGVTAYNGAAPLISSKAFLGAAASILAVEAYHASAVRVNIFAAGQQTPALIDYANKAAAAEGSLGGGKAQGIQVNGTANIVPADENSLAFTRTPGQVANIVYLGGNGKGGFFPNGLNGKITANTPASKSD